MRTPAGIADELVELIEGELCGLAPLEKRIAVNRIRRTLDSLSPQPTSEERRTETHTTPEEDKALGRQTLEFGQYKGQQIDSVPLEYLEWLADHSRDTWKKLHRYLQSGRVHRERRAEDE